MDNWHQYCDDLGLYPGFFDPRGKEDFFKSSDYTLAHSLIKQSLLSNKNSFFKGEKGIGKSTILNFLRSKYEDSEIKTYKPFEVNSKFRIEDIYTIISITIDEDVKLTKKLIDREFQALNLMKERKWERHLFFIDDCELLNKETIIKILDFQSSISEIISFVFFGEDIEIKDDVLVQENLVGLSENEKREYFILLNKKTNEILPYSIPFNEVSVSSKNFYDILYCYIEYAWKVKKGIIEF